GTPFAPLSPLRPMFRLMGNGEARFVCAWRLVVRRRSRARGRRQASRPAGRQARSPAGPLTRRPAGLLACLDLDGGGVFMLSPALLAGGLARSSRSRACPVRLRWHPPPGDG